MTWSKDQVKLLISEYKKYPCLYAKKSKTYMNKHARNEALNNIESALKIIRPDVSITEIKNKFGALRSNFIAENRKWENSKKNGSGIDEIYVPSIWYFEQMKFVLEHARPKIVYDSIQGTNIVKSETLEEELDISLSQEDALNSNATAYDIENTENYSSIFRSTSSTPEDISNPSSSCSVPAEHPTITSPTTSSNRNISLGPTGAKRRKLRSEDRERFRQSAAVTLQTMSKTMSQESTAKEEDDIGIFLMYLGTKLRKIRDKKAYEVVEQDILEIVNKSLKTQK